MFNHLLNTMNNNIKKSFSIRDLENLSGIKAHTIRIWEKRYHLLLPERTATNIRTYSLNSLQKLLNITLLYNNGYKISKIAKLEEDNIPQLVNEIIARNSEKHHAINAFKLAMVNFDSAHFFQTFNSLMVERNFREIFNKVFIPLLNELGLLWQINTISPAHEHFITSLIKQKIYIHTEKFQKLEPTKIDKVFVMFLPENEIHEVGLLFLNYEIVSRGYKTIYLGQSMPLENMVDLLNYYENLHFVSYFTVSPNKDEINKYLEDFYKILNTKGNSKLWLLGFQSQYITNQQKLEGLRVFNSIEQFTTAL